LGAEKGVDGAGEGYGEAGVVGSGDVGCAGAVGAKVAVLACEKRNKSITLTAKRKKIEARD